MAIAFVQLISGHAGGASTLGLTFGSNTTTGNFITSQVSNFGSSGAPTVSSSDNKSNSYTNRLSQAAGTSRATIADVMNLDFAASSPAAPTNGDDLFLTFPWVWDEWRVT